MENAFFKLDFDAALNCVSIYDKRNRRELLKAGEAGKRLVAFEDIPLKWDNWDIDVFYTEKPMPLDAVESVRVLEEGPVRYVLEVNRPWSRSLVRELITLYRDLDRIDFTYEIDWNQSQVLLKTAFPLDINSARAAYEIQYGNVRRPTHRNTSWDAARFEVCGHSWADLSEGDFGVSLLNDSKYGYDIHDGLMRLTLIKSGTDPNPVADQEQHRFTCSLYPHRGTWKEGGTQFMARRLNVPLLARLEAAAHGGDLASACSFVRLDRDNVLVEVIKRAEDGQGLILRLYEYQNTRTELTLSFHRPCREIRECDLLERPLETLGRDTAELKLSLRPYEIKTLRLLS